MSEENVSIVILGVVSLIAVLGLVLMFNTGLTGALGKQIIPFVSEGGRTGPGPTASGLPCSPNPNGQCNQADDCMVGIQTGKCDTRCNCVLTSAQKTTTTPSNIPPQKTLWNPLRSPATLGTPTASGLPCSRNPNGQCSQGDDCMVGIQTGKCDTTCNCQLTQSAPTGKTGKKYVSPAERQGFNPQPEPPGKQAQYVPQATH